MLINKLKRFVHIEPKISGDFCVFLNYSDKHFEKHPQRDFLQIACFDPGIINTGCRIEKRHIDEAGTGFILVETLFQTRIQTASRVPKDKQNPGVKGSKDKEQKCVRKSTEQHYYMKMARTIYDIRRELRECDYILVESQLSRNPEAIRMSQHIVSTILAVSCDFGLLDKEGTSAQRPLIVEVAPYFKSRYFGVRKHRGLDLKKWATIKAFDILERNGDTIARDIIKKDRKKDDQSDVILYCEAWGNTILGHDETVLMRHASDDDSCSE
jgi:hypothetical protein